MPETEHVEVRQSQISGAGRGLFARRDFSPGDLILSLDRPLVAEVEIERMLDTCAWCLQRSERDPHARKLAASMGLPIGFIEVKACTGCRRVVYCSKTCQSRAWKREHKYECKVIAPKERPDLPDGVRAVIKLLGRLKADPADERILAISKFNPAGDAGGLETLSRHNRERFDEYQILALAAYKYTGEPKIAGSDSQALTKSLLCNIMSNLFDLGSPLDETDGGWLGIGFDPFLCNANHSCEPNATLVFNQPQTLLRALKPIKKGEEVLMRYVDPTNPFSVRQADLRERYYFSCQCPKCKKGSKCQEDAFAKRPEELSVEYCKIADNLITRHEANLHTFFVPTNDETAQRRMAALQAEAFSVSRRSTGYVDEEEVKAALKMCINSGMWTWTRQPVPQLCRQLFGLYIASGNPYRAFRLGLKRHFEITPKLHSQPFYSTRLIDLWAMSTVTNVLCGPMHQAIYDEFAQSGVSLRTVYFGFLLDLRDNLPKMYGMESPFGRLVEQTYAQLMANIGTSEAKIRELVKEVWPALEIIARKGLQTSEAPRLFTRDRHMSQTPPGAILHQKRTAFKYVGINRGTSERYLGLRTQFLVRLSVALYLCTGQPPRRTEQRILRWCNTAQGGLHNVFLCGGGVVGLRSIWYKKRYAVYAELPVWRFLPRKFSRLVSAAPPPPTIPFAPTAPDLDGWHNLLSADQLLTKPLKSLSGRAFDGASLRPHDYKYVAIAFSRRFMHGSMLKSVLGLGTGAAAAAAEDAKDDAGYYDGDGDDEGKDDLAGVIDRQASHGSMVANMVYAVK
ncbi:hypothetical protein DL764_008709 [Monosporascus ibericus]|uniref:Uncharacterized protein n=1 Tax=Monosporascus ibericus TaxID=155417 RepID=A0A4Q4SWW0_9PEZI|nr:hypothetical protein DL764_008709 [Monosporascus ibericus]